MSSLQITCKCGEVIKADSFKDVDKFETQTKVYFRLICNTCGQVYQLTENPIEIKEKKQEGNERKPYKEYEEKK